MAGEGRRGLHPVDVLMLERLGAIVDVVDPVPPELVEMGRRLFGFRDPDAVVMEAVGMEAVGIDDVGSSLMSAVRSGWPSRMHFFEFEEVSLDLELTVDDQFCFVLGATTTASGLPVPTGWSVALETTSATWTSGVGDDGRFEFARVPLGMVRVRLDRGAAGRVSTPWLDAG